MPTTLLLDLPSHVLAQLLSHVEDPRALHNFLCTSKGILTHKDDPVLAARWLARCVSVCQVCECRAR